jgi:sugar O-acyltransferase (sialic acid O-acetyltransferase NeuD family)
MTKYYIFGNGQFAELISHILFDEYKIKKKKLFFVVNKYINKKNHILEKDFFKIKNKNLKVFIGIGDIKKRQKIIKILLDKNYQFPNLISKSSKIMKKCEFGKGNIILPSSTILSPSVFQDFNIIGTRATILHHCKINSNCLFGGGALIGAGTNIEKNSFIGVGSVIASLNLNIGSNSFISSGSVVLNNIEKNTKVIGNPARKIL